MTSVGRSAFAKTANGKVVRFCATGNKHNFIWPGTNQAGNFTPRPIDGGPCLLTEEVHT